MLHCPTQQYLVAEHERPVGTQIHVGFAAAKLQMPEQQSDTFAQPAPRGRQTFWQVIPPSGEAAQAPWQQLGFCEHELPRDMQPPQVRTPGDVSVQLPLQHSLLEVHVDVSLEQLALWHICSAALQ